MEPSLEDFCASLTESRSAGLHRKINKYLIDQTSASSAFLICLLESNKEAIVKVVGDKILESPLRLSTTASTVSKAINGTGEMFTLKIMSVESQIRELLDKGDDQDALLHLTPIRSANEKLALIVVLVDMKMEEDEMMRANEIITKLFKFCLTLVVNTIYLEEETRLKQQCQHLLLVARRFFSHLGDLDELLKEIMAEARQLTSAERCSLFLIDHEQGDLVAKVFDGGDGVSNNSVNHPTEVRINKGQGIAGNVAETGRLLNINQAYDHPLFYKGLDEKTGFVTKNILCFPIRDEKEIIGVAQLCNKVGREYFDACDEEIASAFSIYCGISIMHSIVYKKISDAQARTKISNEMLMYHLKVNNNEVNKVLNCQQDHLYTEFSQLHYNCRSLPFDDTLCYILHMFDSLKFSKRFQMKNETLARFAFYVQRGYRDVPYHNWMHAFTVTQFAYAAICTFGLLENQYLTDLECLAFLVSCLCHDLDHRGTNNSFEIREGSLLASLYSSEGSVMECHHLSQAMCILNTEGCNILQELPAPEYDDCLQLLRECILATDLTNHFKQMTTYKEMLAEGYDKNNPKHHIHLLTMLMTCADLCDQIKDWPCVKKVAKAVYTEFFHQGDMEKQRGASPQEMMDRDKAVIPELQINFLEKITLPVFRLLTQMFPKANSCVEIVEKHMNMWQQEKVYEMPKNSNSNYV